MPWVEQVPPVHSKEFVSEDIENEKERISHDGFKVLVSKVYLGGDELQLANKTMFFTFQETTYERTGVTMMESIVSFVVQRPNGRFHRATFSHTSLEGLTFLDISRDPKMSGAFCLNLSIPTSISLQHLTGKGSLADRIDTGDVQDFHGVKKNLYVVLAPWTGNKYVKRGLKDMRDWGDYNMLIRAGQYFSDVRSIELERMGSYNKRIFNRDRAPTTDYCDTVDKNQWLSMLGHDGLTTSDDLDHRNFKYIVQKPAEEAATVLENNRHTIGLDPTLPSGSASGDFHPSPVRHITKIISSPQKSTALRPIQHSTPVAAAVVRPANLVPRVLLSHEGRPTPARAIVTQSPASTSSNNTPRLNTSTASNNNSTFTSTMSSVNETPKSAISVRTLGTVAVSTAAGKVSSAPSSAAASSKGSSGRNTPSPPPVGSVDDSTSLLHYPLRSAESDGITIKFKDMERLSRGEMLNDTIVEFGIRYILYHLLKKEKRDKVHSLSTYFYSSFAAGQNNDKNNHLFYPNNAEKRKEHLAKNYAKVRRWTRKVDIFKKDFVVLPVNNEMHWFLIVVAYPGRALKDKTEPEVAPTSRDEMCQVFVFDSLRDPDEPKRACGFPIMRDYLQFEFEDKKVKKEPNLRFSAQHVCPVFFRDLPQQKNLVDCGVYLLAYLEAFLVMKIPKVPEDKIVNSSEWLPWLRVAVIEFYRDKILHRIKSQCTPQIWDAFTSYEKNQKTKDQPKVTIHKEVDLVDFSRRPRRHEDYCCPDKIPEEPRRVRGVSLPPPGQLVPGLDRIAHKHT